MSPRLSPLDGRPVGFGRQGADPGRPSSTIEGLQMALDLGATGLEADVWTTSDGVPVLNRSAKVGARLRKRAIADTKRADLPDQIATLEDLFGIAGAGFPLSLNIQDSAGFGAVLETARAIGPTAEANLWLCHPTLSELTAWRPNTTAKLINAVKMSDIPSGLERRAADLAQRGLNGLKLFHQDWSGGRIALLHRFGLLALGWGVEYEREGAELVDIGIDAVYSDRVDRLMAVIHEYYNGSAPEEGEYP